VAMVSCAAQAPLAGLPVVAHPGVAGGVAGMQGWRGYPGRAEQRPTAEQVAA